MIRNKKIATGNIETTKTLSWISYPMQHEPLWKTLSLLLMILITLSALYYSLGALYSLLALPLLLISLGKYFFPTTFQLTPSDVSITFLFWQKKRSWSHYSRCLLKKEGLFLSPFQRSTRIDSFRADFLPFGVSDNGEKLTASQVELFLNRNLFQGHTERQALTMTVSTSEGNTGEKGLWKKLNTLYQQAFKISDGRSEVTPEDYTLLDRLAKIVINRGMVTPAILFIESIKPLNFIGSSLMSFFKPFLGAFFNVTEYERIERLLEKRCAGDLLIERIEKAEQEKELELKTLKNKNASEQHQQERSEKST